MRSIERRFRRTFAHWGLALPPEDVEARRRGKIVGGGWAIWYLFGSDEQGEYLDYYASHRMTDDRHVRFCEGSPAEHLPTIRTFLFAPNTPRRTRGLRPSTSSTIAASGPFYLRPGLPPVTRCRHDAPGSKPFPPGCFRPADCFIRNSSPIHRPVLI